MQPAAGATTSAYSAQAPTVVGGYPVEFLLSEWRRLRAAYSWEHADALRTWLRANGVEPEAHRQGTDGGGGAVGGAVPQQMVPPQPALRPEWAAGAAAPAPAGADALLAQWSTAKMMRDYVIANILRS